MGSISLQKAREVSDTRGKRQDYAYVDSKAAGTLSLKYAKEVLVGYNGEVQASPRGAMTPYEAGYFCLALIENNAAGERALAAKILNFFATQQRTTQLLGGYFQQMYPYGQYARVQNPDGTTYEVDSGSALLAWAMARLDQINLTTTYQTAVRRSMNFLRDLQYTMQTRVTLPSNMPSNLYIYPTGVFERTALIADTAECILAGIKALDAYGSTLTTIDGYSVQTMIDNMYYDLASSVKGYNATGGYFEAVWPTDAKAGGANFDPPISYGQALASWAVAAWEASGYALSNQNRTPDLPAVLQQTIGRMRGSHGGFLTLPYAEGTYQPLKTRTRRELAANTALMRLAMKKVDAAGFADAITGAGEFLKMLANADGSVYDFVDENGQLWRGETSPGVEVDGFLILNSALAVLSELSPNP